MNFLGHPGIFILDIGGNDQFKKKIPLLVKETNFENIKVVGIIRDSETDATATFQSIQSVLRNNGLGVPPKRSKFLDGVGENPAIGVFLTPDNTSNSGKLEDLFVATNREHPAIHCVDNYMECLENSLQRKTSDDAKGCQYLPKNMSKARARTLLAAMYYDVKDLGNAAKCGCWNMEHNCLNDLKDFIDTFIRQ